MGNTLGNDLSSYDINIEAREIELIRVGLYVL